MVELFFPLSYSSNIGCKAKLAARNVHAYTLASAIRGTTSIIATNVHHLQTMNLQPLDRRGDNVENQNERRKILIADKPKSSASHGYILILVCILYTLSFDLQIIS